MSKVRTRIAPSPTGSLHVGTARAALFNELFARQHGGEFVLRIEDTDKERSSVEYEATIIEGLKWLGLEWDEGPDVGGDAGPYRQSERTKFYQAAIKKLLEEEKAYEEDGAQLRQGLPPGMTSAEASAGPAIKLKVEDQDVEFEDLVRGKVTVNSDSWGGDFVIARAIDDPVFHLAVVVDDATMEISHVMRGEDHLTNTARHILIQRALGYNTPQYAHFPLLLDEQRKKLSKRSGETNLLAYRDEGFLPKAMLNYLALLGWNPGDNREIFTHEDLIYEFALDKVQKGGAIFSKMKLVAVNKEYMKQMDQAELWKRSKPFFEDQDLDDDYMTRAIVTEQERVGTLGEMPKALAMFLPDWEAEYAPELLVWKKSDKMQTVEHLNNLKGKIESLDERDFEEEKLSEVLMSWIDEMGWGRGDVLWPMRVALTGREHSPGPFEVAAVLGKEETLSRLTKALEKLQS